MAVRGPMTNAEGASMSAEHSGAASHWRAHESAIVEDGAEIGPGTSIWHHCHVRSGSRIGQDCSLGKNVYVDSGVEIGNRVRIQNNVSVYHGVTVRDDVFLGPSCVFTNDLLPRSTGSWEVTATVVSNGASIGANATIVCGNDIGAHAMVGAGAVVTRPVEAHQLVVGNPARHQGWVCTNGHVMSRQQQRPASFDDCTECAAA